MLPDTPFLQFLPPRLHKARQRLAQMIWHVQATPLSVWQRPPQREHLPIDKLNPDEFVPVADTPFHWGRKFEHCWWRVALPAAASASPRYLVWRDQGEATVYHQGSAWYGLDPGHKHCPVPEGADELLIESICCRTGIGVPGEAQGIDAAGSRFEGAFLARRDEEAWHAFHDLDVLIQMLAIEDRFYDPLESDFPSHGFGYRKPFYRHSPLFRQVLRRLNEAVDALDHHGPAAMRPVLTQIYEQFTADSGDLAAVLTGHAHLDLVWLWPERAAEFKAVHSFANALRVLERYPEVYFGYSQPASYEAVARRCPKLMQQVRQRIGQGRWEATGATYVEVDTQLACGEALVRSFQLGEAGFRELRGEPSRVFWLPDVFGYAPCVPQIMAQMGVPYFYTTKLQWSDTTRFPYSSFRWRSPDGSEVVAHLSLETGFNESAEPARLRDAADYHQQADIHPEVLVPSGYGDGGGGITDAIAERARRLANLARVPRTRWGSIEDFFDRLGERRDRLPVYQGELYLEYHRGVQTTLHGLKSTYRACERALQAWEALRCAAGAGPVDEAAWKRVSFAQFHDYLPGSSIHEVYQEALPELEAIARDTWQKAGEEAGGDKRGQACLFNPLPLPRVHVVEEGDAAGLYRLPPLAGGPIAELEKLEASPVRAEPGRLQSERVTAEFDAAGRLTQLRVDGHDLALAGPAAALHLFPDHPAMFDAWDIDRPALSSGEPVTGEAEQSVEALGPHRAALCFSRAIGQSSRISVRYILDAASPVLGIECELDWHEPETLLKMAFPTAYTGRTARYGAPFGSTLRPQLPGELADEAKFEVPASRWAVVADDGEAEGLFLATEARYGFGCRSGLLHVSLMRSPMIPQAKDDRALRDLAYEADHWDLGHHRIRLAVGRHDPDAPRHEQAPALAESLFSPPLAYRGNRLSSALRGLRGGDSLQPVWARPLDAQRWVLRLHETMGRRGKVQLDLAQGWQASLIDLRDQPLESARRAALVGEELRFEPYQLISVLMTKKI